MASLQDSALDSFYLYFHAQQQQQQQQQQQPPPQHQHQTYEPPGSGAVGQLVQQQQQQQQLPQGLGAPRPHAGHTPAGTAVRPGSMVDRARLAKLPQPEHGLKCPRCDSSNTKFCYFNNYSLSQPRHFCKTCRRYWTRGGALRNVPVGGGCRRNKRSKSSGSSKSAAAASSSAGASSSSTMSTGTGGGIGAITSSVPGTTSQLPFLSSLHPLGGDHQYGGASSLGLGFSGLQPIDSLEYQIGSNSGVGLEHWRLPQAQQFPFLGGMEPPTSQQMHQSASGLYPFDCNGGSDGVDGLMSAAQLLPKVSGAGLISQLASVKMEDSAQGLNLMSRHYLALHGNEHFLSTGGGSGGGSSNAGGGWATNNLSNFNSSSGGIL